MHACAPDKARKAYASSALQLHGRATAASQATLPLRIMMGRRARQRTAMERACGRSQAMQHRAYPRGRSAAHLAAQLRAVLTWPVRWARAK